MSYPLNYKHITFLPWSHGNYLQPDNKTKPTIFLNKECKITVTMIQSCLIHKYFWLFCKSQ